MTKHAPSHRIAIIGAGIIGLSCAWEFAQRGALVTLFDPNPIGRGASWAAAGMLAPAYEAAGETNGHPALFDICQHSANLWPSWAAHLERRSGLPSGYSDTKTLAIALTTADKARLAALKAGLDRHAVPYEMLNAASARQYDSALSPEIQSVLLLPSDTHVDNRLTITALIALCETMPNITIIKGEANLTMRGGDFHHDGFDATLITAGWQSAIVKLRENDASFSLVNADPILDEIDPYGGQMLSVAKTPNSPRLTLRADDLYIVPKSDRIIIGATVEPGRTSPEVDTDAIATLRARAAAICPSLAGAQMIETWAGVRPGTSTHAPLLGETTAKGLFVASGHYRNGILLAPITAQIMADLILDGSETPLAAQFSPANFTPVSM
jgi:glycine oxidase